MTDNGIKTGEYRTAEGVSTQVAARGSVAECLNEISGGLRSAMSYCGAMNLADLRKKARFVLVSSSTRFESVPHLLHSQVPSHSA